MDGCVTDHTVSTGPPFRRDVLAVPAVEQARRLLSGYGPARLLSEVSVARVAGAVVESVREPGRWLRPVLAGLDAYRRAQPGGELGPALAAAWAEPWRADQSLADFAAHLGDAGPPELARLGVGPKLWYTVNGVPVSWRPLPARRSAPPTPTQLRLSEDDRTATAAHVLLRAGVSVGELSGLRLGDLGRLVPGEVFVPELLADPLAVRLRPGARGAGHPAPWLVILGHEARIAVVAAVLGRYGTDAACRHGDEPLLPAGDDEVRALAGSYAGSHAGSRDGAEDDWEDDCEDGCEIGTQAPTAADLA